MSLKKFLSFFPKKKGVEVIEYLQHLKKPTVDQCLRQSQQEGTILLQPRCGVGGKRAMEQLLQILEREAKPEILTITIDSYTRLALFQEAHQQLQNNASSMNGFPLVNHGVQIGRKINEVVSTPIQIRHGSPLPRKLFFTSLAAGFSSFEGGGISYNLPYAKQVPLLKSLRSWQEIDRACGTLAQYCGIIVDRELFGTLTAVLVPPSLSLSISILEAILAAREGVCCISVAYPESGNPLQDVSTLRLIPRLIQSYLKANVVEQDLSKISIFPVFHQFMGVFPKNHQKALALIEQGARSAHWGNARKLLTKTCVEAIKIPSVQENKEGLQIARQALAQAGPCPFSLAEIQQEQIWIQQEVQEILSPIFKREKEIGLIPAIVQGFQKGILDIPFAPSYYAQKKVLPARDLQGAIRYQKFGHLAFSQKTKKRNQAQLEDRFSTNSLENSFVSSIDQIQKDIFYFANTSFSWKVQTQEMSQQKKKEEWQKKERYRKGKKILLLVTQSDAHAVGNQIIQLMLEEKKHQVINLGPCTSLQDLGKAYQQYSGVDLIAIGSINGHAEGDLQSLKQLKEKFNISCPIVLGGQLPIHSSSKVLLEKYFSALGVDHLFFSPQELLEFIETF